MKNSDATSAWQPPDGAYFISPTGDDANAGDADGPWRTWAYALGQLRAGDTLVAYPGTYSEAAGTGVLWADCRMTGTVCNGKPCDQGAEGLPITVRALEERQSTISAEGTLVAGAVLLSDCEHWIIHGFDVVGFDEATLMHRNVVRVSEGDRITLRRLVVRRPNSEGSFAAIGLVGTRGVLVEECEVYDFGVSGIVAESCESTTLRRNYINPREREGNGEGIYIAGGRTTVIENNAIEGALDGIRVDNSGGSDIVAGNLLDARQYGFFFANPPEDIRIVDNVAFATATGFAYQTTLHVAPSFAHNTALRYMNTGFAVFNNTTIPTIGLPAFTASLASSPDGDYGFRVTGQAFASVTDSNAFGNGQDYDPPDLNDGTSQSIDPEMGTCMVTIPPSTPMKGAGPDGTDIGANIIWRLEGGVLTDEKLWDQQTGQFPCGATIPGLSDQGDTCTTVHERFHVGYPGCPIP